MCIFYMLTHMHMAVLGEKMEEIVKIEHNRMINNFPFHI